MMSAGTAALMVAPATVAAVVGGACGDGAKRDAGDDRGARVGIIHIDQPRLVAAPPQLRPAARRSLGVAAARGRDVAGGAITCRRRFGGRLCCRYARCDPL